MVGRFSLLAVLAVAVVAEIVNAKPQMLVLHDEDAAESEFPYQASVTINDFPQCFGAIISWRHILTSAKCVNGVNIDELKVVTGSFWSKDGGQNHSPKKIFIHPEFNPANPDVNDIAVVALKEKIEYDGNRKRADLYIGDVRDGFYAILAGWADTTTGPVDSSEPSKVEHLKKLYMKTISTEECQRNGPNVTVVDGQQICAAVDTAFDECRVYVTYGAPLIYKTVLFGILSYGNFPCEQGTPSVFTRVKHHIKWILKVVVEK